MFDQLALEIAADRASRPEHAGLMPGFHPAVRAWFLSRFPDGPTAAQSLGWPRVAAGEDTLIAAPTGSGKTLAGFLVCIDELYRAAERGEAVEGAHPGGLRVARSRRWRSTSSRTSSRRCREIAEVAAAHGAAAAGAAGRGPQRGHHVVGPGRHAAPAAQLPGHHARVALPAGHGRALPGDPVVGAAP